jgi:hypothetical protein
MDEFTAKKLTPKRWDQCNLTVKDEKRDINGYLIQIPGELLNTLPHTYWSDKQFIPLIEDLIERPYEVWLIQLKNTVTGAVRLVQIYFGVYRVEETDEKLYLILKCDPMEGKWVASDLFEVTDDQADKFRFGILMYSKEQNSDQRDN